MLRRSGAGKEALQRDGGAASGAATSAIGSLPAEGPHSPAPTMARSSRLLWMPSFW